MVPNLPLKKSAPKLNEAKKKRTAQSSPDSREPRSREVGKEKEWGTTYGADFERTRIQMCKVFPNIDEKIEKFLDTKLPNPIGTQYNKHDRPMTSLLAGLQHTHLRDDAILIRNY